MTDRQDIVPEGLEAQYEKLGFAPAVRIGDAVHVSGVIGRGPDGNCAEDPATQFGQAFANLGRVLAGCGCGFDDVVEMTTFHVGLQEHMRDFMRAKKAAMGAGPPHPAWTAIGIVELAAPGALVEIRATVAPPS